MNKTLEILSNPALVEKRRDWEKRLADPGETPIFLNGVARSGTTDMYEDPVLRMQEALDELSEQAEILNDEKVFRPLSVNTGLHGVHFIDKIFGAVVYELDGKEGNWQAEHLPTPPGELSPPDLENSSTWIAARKFAQAFVDSGVTVPVFMLPTIASALNIGLNLYGQELLITMLTDPEAAKRDLEIINGVLVEIHQWYRDNIPFEQLHQVCSSVRYQPPGCGQICGCSTQLLSADQYREFILPLDNAILFGYPNGGMIHLCGAHTQHLEIWREMESLTSVQVNDLAAEELEIYLDEMPGKVYYVNPCEGMLLEKVESLAINHKIVICG